MAMINDKGPEESRDTDATYIILSHQSVHLPGPSWQRGGGVGRGSRGAGREGRQRERDREKEKEREGELSTSSTLHRGIAFLLLAGEWQKEKQVTKR